MSISECGPKTKGAKASPNVMHIVNITSILHDAILQQGLNSMDKYISNVFFPFHHPVSSSEESDKIDKHAY